MSKTNSILIQFHLPSMKKAEDLLMRVNHVFLTPQNQKNFGSCSTYGFCDMYYSHIYPNRLDDWYNGSNRISIWYLTKRDVISKEWSYIICLEISDNDEYNFLVSLQILRINIELSNLTRKATSYILYTTEEYLIIMLSSPQLPYNENVICSFYA